MTNDEVREAVYDARDRGLALGIPRALIDHLTSALVVVDWIEREEARRAGT